jgi:hypothetical protein
LYGLTSKGTRYGAFIVIGPLTHEGRRFQVVIESTNVVIIDDAQSGDGISLINADGTQTFTFFGEGIGGPGPRAGEVVAGSDFLPGLALSEE